VRGEEARDGGARGRWDARGRARWPAEETSWAAAARRSAGAVRGGNENDGYQRLFVLFVLFVRDLIHPSTFWTKNQARSSPSVKFEEKITG
jgi:hypothetical protein